MKNIERILIRVLTDRSFFEKIKKGEVDLYSEYQLDEKEKETLKSLLALHGGEGLNSIVKASSEAMCLLLPSITKGLMAEQGIPSSQIVPKLENVAPKLESIASKLDKVTPKLERVAPKLERVVPKLERVVPDLERIAPKLERVAPKLEKVNPKLEEVLPKLDKVANKIGKIETLLENFKSKKE